MEQSVPPLLSSIALFEKMFKGWRSLKVPVNTRAMPQLLHGIDAPLSEQSDAHD